MSDPYFMYALVKAEAGRGRFAEAQTAIRVLAARQPGIVKDADFLATVDFIFAEMERARGTE